MLSTLPYYAKAPLIYGAMSLKSMVLTNHTIEVLMNPPLIGCKMVTTCTLHYFW